MPLFGEFKRMYQCTYCKKLYPKAKYTDSLPDCCTNCGVSFFRGNSVETVSAKRTLKGWVLGNYEGNKEIQKGEK